MNQWREGIELLAPAGDWESFVAAVENGADAVYLGGKILNARQFANNFDSAKLRAALDYAHVRGARIYLTMNTLVSDKELKEALDFAGEAYEMGIDAIIVQDLGLACLLREFIPELHLHASTQMTIYDLDGVRALEKLGFKRVVPARELTLDEIKNITGNTSLEVEVFVHGALCVSYSGQCLMSSIIGGRSGNRGKCAQPCRLPYKLVSVGKKPGFGDRPAKEKDNLGKYLLSPKDLCTIDMLEKISASGVKSLKIEGRMKSPEYVATVVGTYRKYLDRLECAEAAQGAGGRRIEPEDMLGLSQIFNRGGFSKGYLQGKTGSDMMCFEKPKNWGVPVGKVVSSDDRSRTVCMKLDARLSVGDGIEVWNGQEESPGGLVSEIRHDGRNMASAEAGMTVSIGAISGRMSKGDRVYKTSDKQLVLKARSTFEGKSKRKSPVDGKLYISKNQPARLVVGDKAGNTAEALGGIIPEKAVNRPLTAERVMEQLRKTGDTPYYFESIDVQLDEDISLPVSEINNIRRAALDELENKAARSYDKKLPDELKEKWWNMMYSPGNSRIKPGRLKLSGWFLRFDKELDYAGLGFDRIYLPFRDFIGGIPQGIKDVCRKKGTEVFAWLPSVTRGNFGGIIGSELDKVLKSGADGILAGNISALVNLNKHPGISIMGDFTLNAYNSFSVGCFKKLGFSGVTLSTELSIGQIEKMNLENEGFLNEAVIYGRIPLMTSEYCPVGCVAGGFSPSSKCGRICNKADFALKDRLGMEFPVACDSVDCRSTVYNSSPLFAADVADSLKRAGVGMLRMLFTDEEPGYTAELAGMFRDIADGGTARMKRYEGLVEKIKAGGFTRGHYYRGV